MREFAGGRFVYWRVDRMTVNLNKPASEGRQSPWVQFVRVLLLIAFVVTVFLIGSSMVHHRFFRGGRIDRYGRVSP